MQPPMWAPKFRAWTFPQTSSIRVKGNIHRKLTDRWDSRTLWLLELPPETRHCCNYHPYIQFTRNVRLSQRRIAISSAHRDFSDYWATLIHQQVIEATVIKLYNTTGIIYNTWWKNSLLRFINTYWWVSETHQYILLQFYVQTVFIRRPRML